jgi:hypothetical protein
VVARGVLQSTSRNIQINLDGLWLKVGSAQQFSSCNGDLGWILNIDFIAKKGKKKKQ